MADLTATFVANFSSFYDAVNEAKIKLTDFEGGADKVSASLDRMANTLSGRKLIQDATMMAEAVEQLGGTSRLTEAELERLGAKAAEAVEKMRALGIKDIPENLQRLADASATVTHENETLGVSVTSLVQSYLTAEAAIKVLEGAYELLVGTMKDAVAAAAEAEQADTQVLGALKAQGTAVPSVVSAYDEYAKALQRTTIYSTAAAKAAESMLVTVGGVMPRDMEKALLATANLATGLGKDLPEAAMMLAKAASGSTEALSKYGIEVTDSEGHTKSFDQILTTVNGTFHDFAEQAGNTAAGGLAKLKNSWGDVLESLGRVITQNETVRTALAGLNQLLIDNTGELNSNQTANRLVSEAVIGVAKAASLFIEALDYLQKEVRDARVLFNTFGEGIDSLGISFASASKSVAQLTAMLAPGIVGEQARKDVQDLSAYIETLQGRLQAHREAIQQAKESSTQWGETLAGFNTRLQAFTAGLDNTVGATHRSTQALQENDFVWQQTTKNMKAAEDARQAAAAAQAAADEEAFKKIKAQAQALEDLANISQDFHVTVAALDTAVVESIKNYLAAGVAQNTLATAYGLSNEQIAAVGKSLKEEQELEKQAAAYKLTLAKLDADYYHAKTALSKDSLAVQEADIDEWVKVTLAALEKVGQKTDEAAQKVQDIADQQKANLVEDRAAQDKTNQEYYEQQLKAAERNYNDMLAHQEEFSTQSLEIAYNKMVKAQEDLAHWGELAQKEFETVTDVAGGTAAAFGRVTDAIQGSIAAGTGFADQIYAMQHLTQDFVNQMTGGGTLASWVNFRVAGFGSAAAMNQSYGGGMAEGGQVTAGQTYLVGERGPELFSPGTSGTIIPNGGGTSVVIQPGAIQMNFPVVNDPRALDALARTVGDAILKKMTRTGARV